MLKSFLDCIGTTEQLYKHKLHKEAGCRYSKNINAVLSLYFVKVYEMLFKRICNVWDSKEP